MVRFKILEELKRSGVGLPVAELANRLSMSYMGIKDQCEVLLNDGYVSTWRNPRPIGRPEKLYRLTLKAGEFFPQPDNAVLIDFLRNAAQLYGVNAPGKLLVLYFKNKTEFYEKRLQEEKGPERIKRFVALRDQEGHYARLELAPSMRLIENHQPLSDVFEAFPEARQMEENMVARLLSMPVQREEKWISGAYECVFTLG